MVQAAGAWGMMGYAEGGMWQLTFVHKLLTVSDSFDIRVKEFNQICDILWYTQMEEIPFAGIWNPHGSTPSANLLVSVCSSLLPLPLSAIYKVFLPFLLFFFFPFCFFHSSPPFLPSCFPAFLFKINWWGLEGTLLLLWEITANLHLHSEIPKGSKKAMPA